MAAAPLTGAPCADCGGCGFNPFGGCGCGNDCPAAIIDNFDRPDASTLGTTTSGQLWLPGTLNREYALVSHAAADNASDPNSGLAFIDATDLRAATDGYYITWDYLTNVTNVMAAVLSAAVFSSPTGTTPVGGVIKSGANITPFAGLTGGPTIGPPVPFVAGVTIRVEAVPSTGAITTFVGGVVGASAVVALSAFDDVLVGMFANVISTPSARLFDTFEVGCLA